MNYDVYDWANAQIAANTPAGQALAGGTEYQVFLYDGNKTCTPSYVGAFTAQ